jgi:hypothetical protein
MIERAALDVAAYPRGADIRSCHDTLVPGAS